MRGGGRVGRWGKGVADGKKELLEMTLVRTWKKKDGKISGSIFDPEKGAALPGGGGRGSGGGLGGVGGREK